MGENFADPIAMRPAQEQATRLRPDVAKALAAFADRRRVDQRQRLLEIARDEGVEQRLVGILQPAQEDIALEVRLQVMQRLHPAIDLLLEASDMGR